MWVVRVGVVVPLVPSGKESWYALCVRGRARGRRLASDSASGGCCAGSTVV